MIVDCFLFFNELDLLEIRLHELDSKVDRFILVEADRTFSGAPKPYYFLENKLRYKEFLRKIIGITVKIPEGTIGIACDKFQRNNILSGLRGCKPDDVILISDVDEIPDLTKVDLNDMKQGVSVFEQGLYFYYVNCKSDELWYGTRAIPYRLLGDVQHVRFSGGRIVENGGWHFSYLGGPEKIKVKIEACYQWRPISGLSELHIQKCFDERVDIFGRSMEFHISDEGLPLYLHMDKYKGFFFKGQKNDRMV